MGDVQIRIRATDETGRTFDGVIEGLEGLGQRQRQVAQDQERANQAWRTGSDILGRSMQVLTRLDLIQLTVEGSTERVRHAQMAHNESLRQFGPTSEQAATTSRQLEKAQRELEKTNLRVAASYATIGLAAAEAGGKALAAAGGVKGLKESSDGLSASLGKIPILGALALGALAAIGGHAAFDDMRRRAAALNAELDRMTPEERLEETRRALEHVRTLPEGMRRAGDLFGFGRTLEDRAEAEFIDAAEQVMDARIRKTEEMIRSLEKMGEAHVKQRAQIDAAGIDQRLFEVSRAVQDLADAGNLPGLQALRDNLFGQLAGALGTEQYKEFADAVTIANNALSSLGKDRARGIEDSLDELGLLEERQHQQALARIEGEYRAKEAAIQREIAMVESLRQVKRSVEEEQRALGARVFRSSSAAFSNMGEFERIAHLVAARGGSLEDVQLMLGGISSLSMSGQARHALGLPNVPGLAEGGIVRATPGGTIVRLGEGGRDEAVVPLGRGNQGMGNVIVELTQNFYGPTEPAAVRQATTDGLNGIQRRLATRETI